MVVAVLTIRNLKLLFDITNDGLKVSSNLIYKLNSVQRRNY